MSYKRIIAAFLIAPLATPSVLSFYDLTEGYALSFPMYALFAYLAVLVFGLPAFFLYRYLTWTNLFLFIIGGAIIGYAVSLLIFEGHRVERTFVVCLVAALSALVFRIIVLGVPFIGSKPSLVRSDK